MNHSPPVSRRSSRSNPDEIIQSIVGPIDIADFYDQYNETTHNSDYISSYKIVDGIDPNAITWVGLCKNPNDKAIDILEKNMNKIDRECLVALSENVNPRATRILLLRFQKIYGINTMNYDIKIEKNTHRYYEENGNYELYDDDDEPDKRYRAIIYENLSKNVNNDAVLWCTLHPEKVSWTLLALNPNDRAVDLLINNYEKWKNRKDSVYTYMCLNRNDKAVSYLLEHGSRYINFKYLSTNPNDMVINFLSKNKKHINKEYICMNPNDKAIQLLRTLKFNEDNINLNFLSRNPCDEAMNMLSYDTSKIKWEYLIRNPSNKAIKLVLQNATLHYNPYVVIGNNIYDEDNPFFWNSLQRNPNKRKLDFLMTSLKINPNYNILSTNPSIFDKDEEKIEKNLTYLPKDITGIISDYAGHASLLEWIDPYKLNVKMLIRNPNVKALELIEPYLDPSYDTDELFLSEDDRVIDFVKKHEDFIDWSTLFSNHNDRAVRFALKHRSDDVNWSALSANPSDEAVDLLMQYPDYIEWEDISENTNERIIDIIADKGIPEYLNDLDFNLLSKHTSDTGIEFLTKFINDINWEVLSLYAGDGPKSIELLAENPDKIVWSALSKNPKNLAIEFLLKNPEKINWKNLSLNSNDKALEMLSNHIEKVNWKNLSANPNPKAIELIYTYIHDGIKHKLDWSKLSSNTNDLAIELLLMYPKYINWKMLSSNSNPKALKILSENQNKIDWDVLSMNPGIFKADRNFLYGILDLFMK